MGSVNPCGMGKERSPENNEEVGNGAVGVGKWLSGSSRL
jgi:hypothetical protein